MGQKINPISFRLKTHSTSPEWMSSWFAQKSRYKELLLEDYKIREALQKRLSSAGIVSIRIERSAKKIKLILAVSRPGLVIGRGGKELESVKNEVQKLLTKQSSKTNIDIQVEEFKNVDLSAKLIAEKISYQLAKRMPYRRVVLSAVEKSMAAGVKGIKVILSGRINGAEISRREKFHQGQVPLSTIKARVDYAEVPCLTRSGYIGVKVYLCLAV
ncbi:MAG TPA: 30S ribosomal protein S3 [Candidatus Methanoperedens sp.]|nr:30S ribosomal protein S3 [Candidatus Methanoperedens sp.]